MRGWVMGGHAGRRGGSAACFVCGEHDTGRGTLAEGGNEQQRHHHHRHQQGAASSVPLSPGWMSRSNEYSPRACAGRPSFLRASRTLFTCSRQGSKGRKKGWVVWGCVGRKLCSRVLTSILQPCPFAAGHPRQRQLAISHHLLAPIAHLHIAITSHQSPPCLLVEELLHRPPVLDAAEVAVLAQLVCAAGTAGTAQEQSMAVSVDVSWQRSIGRAARA